MCLYASKSLHMPQAAQYSGGFVAPRPQTCRTRPHSCSSRRQLQLNAILLQDVPAQEMPGASQRVGITAKQGSSSPGGMPSSRPVQQASAVEVHFQVQYACEFGQHLSLIGSPQGWQVPAAVPMSWSDGNVWNAVLPVPAGADIEYKYIVVWDDGLVSRWQDGPNNKLSVQHPGVLMHVQDTWSQKERSVREVGPRLDKNQHNKQSGGHSSGAAAPSAAAAAATAAASLTAAAASPVSPAPTQASSSVPAQASAPGADVPRSSSGASSDGSSAVQDAAAAVLPMQPTWAGVLQPHSLLYEQFAYSAAADDDEPLQYEDEEEDQHWPADMLQKAAAAAAAVPSTAAPPVSSGDQAQQAAQPAQRALSPAAAPEPSATPTAHIMAAAAAAVNSRKQTQLQKQQSAAANLAELLPMLRTELESALAELAQHPEAAHEHGRLLSEGQSVLAALQQQVAANSITTGGGSASSSSSCNSSSSTTGGPSASSSSSNGSRSPVRSPSVTLTSGDEIAAALLSDDCEEACFCMVDAICSCSDWDLSCSCEDDPDTPCELSEGESDLPAQIAAHKAVAHRSHSSAAAQPARAPAPAAQADSNATSESGNSTCTAAPTALSLAELTRAAALAARHDPAVLAARAAAFTDVQTAMEKSAQLLQALSDPCHPLMLEADRNLATASRQLHSGHLLN